MTFIIAKPWAVYNEIEEYAADWIENLIALGVVAPGVVDRRSVEDVQPDDYRGFRQVHLFAGIAVWSYAFRCVGIPDDFEAWTLSCPCQPFSAAGKGTGMVDERHLWPAAYHLIRERRPGVFFGEQVASKDGLGWLDLVQADVEAADYALWAVDTCSAGSGAPHLRQRLRLAAENLRSASGLVGHNSGVGWQEGRGHGASRHRGPELGSTDASESELVVDGECSGLEGQRGGHRPEERQREEPLRPVATTSGIEWVADDRGERVRDQGRRANAAAPGGVQGEGLQWQRLRDDLGYDGSVGVERMADQPDGRWGEECSNSGRLSEGDRAQREPTGSVDGWLFGNLADDNDDRCPAQTEPKLHDQEHHAEPCSGFAGRIERPGPTNGFWGDADWLFCRDGKWRPVEPSYVEMVDGTSPNLGRGGAFVEDHEDAETRLQAMLDTFGEEEIQQQAGRSWALREEGLLRPILHGRLDGRSDQELDASEQSKAVGEDGRGRMRDLRSVGQSIGGASSGREPVEQRPLELADIVRLLPQSLSLAELWGRRRDANELRLLREAINQEGSLLDPPRSGAEVWASLSQEAKDRIGLAFDVGAWRRVVSFPLVNGDEFKLGSGSTFEGKSRQGMLKGYGNAIDAQATIDFLRAYLEGAEERSRSARSLVVEDALLADL